MKTGELYQKDDLGYSDGRTGIRAIVLDDNECRLIYDLLLSRKLEVERQHRTMVLYYKKVCRLISDWKDCNLPR